MAALRNDVQQQQHAAEVFFCTSQPQQRHLLWNRPQRVHSTKLNKRRFSSPNGRPAVVSKDHNTVFNVLKSRMCWSAFSPDGSFEFEEFLGGLDHPDIVARQDAGAQEEAHIPVALQLVQAALFAQQAAQLHSWKTRLGLSFASLSRGWKRTCSTHLSLPTCSQGCQ